MAQGYINSNQQTPNSWNSSQLSTFDNHDLANIISWTTANTTSGVLSSGNVYNFDNRGVILYLNIVSGVGATANAQLTVNNIDPGSGVMHPVLVGAPVAANAAGSFVYTIYPGLTAASNVTVTGVLSRTWCANVTVTATGANTSTGSLSASMIL